MARQAGAWWVALSSALVIGVLVAPSLAPMALLPLSVLWLGGGALVVGRGLAAVRRSWGTWPAAVVTLVGVAGPVWLFGTDWTGTAGTYLPCRRNWAWLPSYLLRSSPTESVTAVIGETRIKICYGSPRSRGRKMIGGPRVPFGRLWRTGANEPTTIRFNKPLEVGGISVGRGNVSLYTVPGPETWEIVLNQSTRQWGIESVYPDVAAEEIGRAVVVSRKSTEFADVLGITIERTSRADSVEVVLRWEGDEVRIPVRSPFGKIQDRASCSCSFDWFGV